MPADFTNFYIKRKDTDVLSAFTRNLGRAYN